MHTMADLKKSSYFAHHVTAFKIIRSRFLIEELSIHCITSTQSACPERDIVQFYYYTVITAIFNRFYYMTNNMS